LAKGGLVHDRHLGPHRAVVEPPGGDHGPLDALAPGTGSGITDCRTGTVRAQDRGSVSNGFRWGPHAEMRKSLAVIRLRGCRAINVPVLSRSHGVDPVGLLNSLVPLLGRGSSASLGRGCLVRRGFGPLVRS
jgi:hypothetical protein